MIGKIVGEDAGVVDESVDIAMLGGDCLDGGLEGVAGGDVALEVDDLAMFLAVMDG